MSYINLNFNSQINYNILLIIKVILYIIDFFYKCIQDNDDND